MRAARTYFGNGKAGGGRAGVCRALLCLLSAAALILLSAPGARAQETVPGDACSAAGEFKRSSGANMADGGYFLFCDGANWQDFIRFTSTQYVGISQDAPAAALDILGTLKISYGGEACDAAREGAIHYDSSSDEFYVCRTAGGWEMLPLAGSSVSFTSLTDTPSSYSGAGGQFLRVNSGATAVEFTDQVIETVTGQPAPTGTNLTDLDDVSAAGPSADDVLTWNGSSWVAQAAGGGAAAGNDREVQFNSGGAMAGDSRFTFLASGDLSVEVDSGRTVAFGTPNAQPGIHINRGGGNEGRIYRGSAGLHIGTQSPTYGIFIDNNDLVGIGTGTPQTQLDVDGTIKMAWGGEACDAAREGAIRYDSSTQQFDLCDGSSGWQSIATSAGGSLWTQNGSDIYRDTGNVAIGRTVPNYSLDVDGDINFSSRNGIYYNSMSFARYLRGVNADTLALGTLQTHGAYDAATNNGRSVYVGIEAGRDITTGDNNTLIGYQAGYQTTTGNSNVFVGDRAGQANDTGSRNTFLGWTAGFNNTGGQDNVMIGYGAGQLNATGANNVAIGRFALQANDGGHNVVVGSESGSDLTNGAFNILIGRDVEAPEPGTNYYLNIGDILYGSMNTGEIVIGGNGALRVPVGDNSQRPGTAAGTTAVNGMLRYNSASSKFEGYQGGSWQDIITTSGGLWTDNTQYISYNSAHFLNAGGTMTDAGFNSNRRSGFVYHSDKSALRVGETDNNVSAWDEGNVGTNSVALGYNNMASGDGAIALGTGGYVPGNQGISIGSFSNGHNYRAIAVGHTSQAYYNSLALGVDAIAAASSGNAYTFGRQVTATGINSFALGSYATAGDGQFVGGFASNGSVDDSIGEGAMAIGLTTGANAPATAPTVTGDESLGIFMGDQSGVDLSSANTMALLGGDFIVGSYQMADTGDTAHDNRMFFDRSKGAFRAGQENDGDRWAEWAVGDYSAAFGRNNFASGQAAFAGGIYNYLTGYAAVAFGENNTANGSNSVALGYNNAITADNSLGLGQDTEVSAPSSMAIGLGDTDLVNTPQVSASNSLGIFMGDQSGVNLASSNVFGLFGGEMMIDYSSASAGRGCIRYNEGGSQLEYSHDCATYSAFGGGGGLWTDNTTHVTYNSVHILNTGETSTSAGLDGDGTRVFFDPDNGALRGGAMSGGDGWQSANIGAYSFAWGLNVESSGMASFAGGDGSEATNGGAIALGNKAHAIGANAVALGQDNRATGTNAMSIGLGNSSWVWPTVSGDSSLGIFMGDQTGVDLASSNVMALIGGSLGIGTVTPDYVLDVKGDPRFADYADPAVVRITRASGSEGSETAVANGDVIGGIAWMPHDGTNYEDTTAYIQAVVNGAVATDDVPTDLRFRVDSTGAGAGPLERMRITSNGRFIFGDDADSLSGTPASTFHFRADDPDVRLDYSASPGGSNIDIQFAEQGTVGGSISWNRTDDVFKFATDKPASGDGAFAWEIGNTEHMRLTSAGYLGIGDTTPDVALDVVGDIHYTGVIQDVSDRRAKDNINALPAGQLGKLMQLDGVSFTMKGDPDARVELGLIAQDVEKVFPELVATDGAGMKSLNYTGLIAPLIEASKELKAENDALRAEVAELRAAQDDILQEVKGLKAHTGYGVDKAQIGLWALLVMLASSPLFFLLGSALGKRRHRSE